MIITFLGTKGGTGTTTMAVNCGADIHRISGRPTIVVDAKPAPGDVALFMGLRPRHSVVDYMEHQGWENAAAASRIIVRHDSGVHVLASDDGFGRPDARDADAIEETLHGLTARYDVVIVDAGSALSPLSSAVLAVSDLVLLVANPDVPCLRNLQRFNDALRLAQVLPERVRVLLNRMSEHDSLPATEIEAALGRRIDFQVPSDYRTVAAAVNAGVPVASLRQADLHAHLDALARALIGMPRGSEMLT